MMLDGLASIVMYADGRNGTPQGVFLILFYWCLFYMVENGGRGVVFDSDSFFKF